MGAEEQEAAPKHKIIDNDTIGPISVYVQGSLDKHRDGVVFLTVHDVGASYKDMEQFVTQEEMEPIRYRCVFVHVSVPGQEPGAEDLDAKYNFPEIDQLAINLVTVLDVLRVKQVVGLGCGAGASILARFGLFHPTRLVAMLGVNTCLALGASVKDRVREAIGAGVGAQAQAQGGNQKNVTKFLNAYMKRGEVLNTLKEKMKYDLLLITGSSFKQATDTEKIHASMPPGTCSMLKIENVSNPMSEAVDKVSEALLLFCQGLGLMPTATRKGSRTASSSSGGRRPSMSDLDIPNIQRLLVKEHEAAVEA